MVTAYPLAAPVRLYVVLRVILVNEEAVIGSIFW
jgi:hypothetical protein